MSDVVLHAEHLPVVPLITPPRIRPGDRLEINAVTYEAVRKVDRRMLFVREDTGAEVWVDASTLVQKFASGEARIALPTWLPKARYTKWDGDFASLPKDEKRRAYMRCEYVEAMVENARLGYPPRSRRSSRTFTGGAWPIQQTLANRNLAWPSSTNGRRLGRTPRARKASYATPSPRASVVSGRCPSSWRSSSSKQSSNAI